MHKHTLANTTVALGWTLGAHRRSSTSTSLIKITVLVLVRFSRENKHFPHGPCWLKMWRLGGPAGTNSGRGGGGDGGVTPHRAVPVHHRGGLC